MKKKYYLIAILVVVLLVIIFLFSEGGVKIITDKKEYKRGDALKVKIENKLKSNNICFSSCYPYYLERKDGEWESYIYPDCKNDNLINNCVGAGEVKAFELILSPLLEEKIHRLALPACMGCNIQEVFREDQKFYSNEFIVE